MNINNIADNIDMNTIIESCTKHLEMLKLKLFEKTDGLFDRYKVFISVGYKSCRASVVTGVGNTIDSAYEAAYGKAVKRIKYLKMYPDWFKLDCVVREDILSIDEFIDLSQKTWKGFMQYGICFDQNYNFAFLGQEVNAASFIKYNKCPKYTHHKNEKIDSMVGILREGMPTHFKCAINFDNINAHLKKTRGQDINIKDLKTDKLIVFDTISFFCDKENVYEIEDRQSYRTRRKIYRFDTNFIKEILSDTSEYLAGTVRENGRFIYGYFPCFDNQIQGYNCIRHSHGVFALSDAYSVTKNPLLLEAMAKILDYLKNELLYYVDDKAYAVDYENDNEIKLGALSLALLAIAKYMEAAGPDEKSIQIMKSLGNGIISMQNEDTGKFFHVWRYPDLEKVDEFRIIYYAGEAAFALMKLYSFDKNEKWLNAVKKAFDFFIKNDYWQYSDHWLAYCTNELTSVADDDEYYKFGLKNAFLRLDFIENRITAYHTFLELLCATYKMVKNIENRGKSYLLHDYDIERLKRAIDSRVDRQLNSVFFPEIAMYFKSPQKILNGIFVRQDNFRTRNDDVSHHISGLSLYLKEILNYM